MFHACFVGNNPEPTARLIKKVKASRYFQCPIPAYNAAEFLTVGPAASFNLIFVDSGDLTVDQYLIARIKRYHADAEIIALATSRRTPLLIELLQAGVDGFVLQNTTPEEFQFMISSFNHGGPFMSSQTLRQLILAAPSVFLRNAS